MTASRCTSAFYKMSGLKKPVKIFIGVGSSLCVIFLVCAAIAYYAQPAPDHPFFSANRTLVIAHRGGRGLWPEGTLYAFEQALTLGVDVLDMDLRATRDGVLVVMHDKAVDRTTDGTGAVGDYTLAELKKLDAAFNWSIDGGRIYPLRGKGIRIPTLTEVFREFPDTHLDIEIKEEDPAAITALCDSIKKYRMTDQVLVDSFKSDVLKAFRRVCPQVATSAGATEAQIFYGLYRIGLQALFTPASQALQLPQHFKGRQVVTQSLVAAAHERNLKVYVWTVNDPLQMHRLLRSGVDGIITDFPDRMLRLLGR
jgi:glycerophosphoryl diester phosphodiesterase